MAFICCKNSMDSAVTDGRVTEHAQIVSPRTITMQCLTFLGISTAEKLTSACRFVSHWSVKSRSKTLGQNVLKSLNVIKDLDDKWQLNESRKYCRMLPLEHSAICLTCIKR